MALSDQPEIPAAVKQETLAYWVNIAAVLGFPRTVGEIYGLLFLSESPLSADDLVDELGISRSGAGQGLKALLDIGAIKPAHQVAIRKEHFQLQTDLGVLVKNVLQARILPKLESLKQQQDALSASAQATAPAHLAQRFEKLARWQQKASPLLAVLKSLA